MVVVRRRAAHCASQVVRRLANTLARLRFIGDGISPGLLYHGK
jgi:hypothetical protein